MGNECAICGADGAGSCVNCAGCFCMACFQSTEKHRCEPVGDDRLNDESIAEIEHGLDMGALSERSLTTDAQALLREVKISRANLRHLSRLLYAAGQERAGLISIAYFAREVVSDENLRALGAICEVKSHAIANLVEVIAKTDAEVAAQVDLPTRPTPIPNADLAGLRALAEQFVDFCEGDEFHEDHDFKAHFFEAALVAIYGEGFFSDYYNRKVR